VHSARVPDAMMAGVGGNVIALVFAALVALPVSAETGASYWDVLLSDRTSLAVAGTARGTVLARVKALRFASTLAGAAVGLDPGCARRRRVEWATADGGSLGSDSGLPKRTRGLPHRGRHNFLYLGSNQGLVGRLDRTGARALLGGGFPSTPFRLRGGVTVPP
jgi:hypothetical protein